MKRQFISSFIAGLLGALLVSCSPEKTDQPESRTQPAVAEDRLLTVEAYLQMGMPSPDRKWTPEDYSQAVLVLKSLSQKDARDLPRCGSKTSGRLFDRIASRENLAAMLDDNLPLNARMPLTLGYLDGVQKTMLVYFEASTRGVILDAESAELLGLMLKVAQESAGMADRFMASIPKDDPKLSVRQEGFARMKDGLVATFNGAIISLSETNFYDVPARLKVCGYLRETLPPVVAGFPPAVQTEIPLRIKRLQETEPDDRMKSSLAELHETIVSALAH